MLQKMVQRGCVYSPPLSPVGNIYITAGQCHCQEIDMHKSHRSYAGFLCLHMSL